MGVGGVGETMAVRVIVIHTHYSPSHRIHGNQHYSGRGIQKQGIPYMQRSFKYLYTLSILFYCFDFHCVNLYGLCHLIQSNYELKN